MSKVFKESVVWYSLEGSKNTVGDLREFVKEMDLLSVPDEYALDDCIVTFSYKGDVQLILDGESKPYIDKCDVLVTLNFSKEKEQL